ncbi:MAG: glucose-6-phosphate dehydrogenase [Chthoniobacterales bacterium]|nr:glucose-6-phosphate dehydrogenase [Chthoniobacterales bacterium]
MNSNPPAFSLQPLASRLAPESCTLVIFGATGDLTHRKLIPALYNLAVEGALPAGLNVVGFARREKSNEEFRDELKVTTQKFSRTSLNEEIWNRFAQSISYHRSEFHDLNGYCRLVEQLGKDDLLSKSTGNRLFYLAVAPDQVEVILHNLKESGLNFPREGSWARVIIEKPFGVDLKTAHHLNKLVHGAFPEKETYRIDHYLGKETAQNIMVLRFANSIFESIWNSKHVHHVQITAAEPLGVEGRAGYYDKAGALRDMVQNHLLQLLTLMAMEPPMSMSADAIRDEKVKVLKSLRPLRGKDVFKNVVRGQYAEGIIKGQPVPAYRSEPGVAPESTTESYVALQIAIDNWRWAGVPFFVRAGKRMAHTGSEIAITFNAVPPVLFNTLGHTLERNVLVIRIQPNEGISLGMSAKTPGSTLQIEPVKMNFCYGTSFQKQNPEAYERLLLDAMSGDATLFARSDEVEAAWTFVDGIEEAWLQSSDDLKFYPSGGCGPEAADDLLAASGAVWRML